VSSDDNMNKKLLILGIDSLLLAIGVVGRNNKMSEEKCKVCGNQLFYTDEKTAKVCRNPKCPRYFKIPSEW